MATVRVPCKYCGAMVLPSTSMATGGKCMPCYKRGRGKGDYLLRITRPDDFLKIKQHKLVTIKHFATCTHVDFDEACMVFEDCMRRKEIILKLDSPLDMKQLAKALHHYGYTVTLL